MESTQLNNTSNEDAVAELLTLRCEVDEHGTKCYYNREGEIHRIHGPAIIYENGAEFWCKNEQYHREDGPAVRYGDGDEEYYVDDVGLSKEEFIQWQKDHGIKPIK